MTKKILKLPVQVKDLGEGIIEAVIATDSTDRHGEQVDIQGMELEQYMDNPVVAWGHMYNEPAIAQCLNLVKRQVGAVWQLVATMQFAVQEYDFANTIYKLYKGGYMRAFSIGFMPLEMEGNRFTKSSMLEFSAVLVPANAEALTLAKAKGINTESLELVTKGLKHITKGEVNDELAADQAREDKWNNMEDVYEILNAFMDVYYDEATPVENFNQLLGEVITLLQSVVDGTYAEDETESTVIEAIKRLKGSLTALESNTQKAVEKIKAKQTKTEPEMTVFEQTVMAELKELKQKTLGIEETVSSLTQSGSGRVPKEQLKKARVLAKLCDKNLELVNKALREKLNSIK